MKSPGLTGRVSRPCRLVRQTGRHCAAWLLTSGRDRAPRPRAQADRAVCASDLTRASDPRASDTARLAACPRFGTALARDSA